MKCAVKECKQEAPFYNEKYFVIPAMIAVPNCYLLCDEHYKKGVTLEYEYFYDEKGNCIWRDE